MTDTVPPPAPPVEPAGPGQVSCDRPSSAPAPQTRFRPVLEQLEAREVPSVGVIGAAFDYGKTSLYDLIPAYTPALAYKLTIDTAAIASDIALSPTPARGPVTAPTRFDADAADRLAGLFRPRLGRAEVIPNCDAAPVATDDVVLDDLRFADDIVPGKTVSSGTDSLIAVASVAGSAVLLVLALRQKHAHGGGTTGAVVRFAPRRAPVPPRNKAADEEQPWPALAALLREEQEATSSSDADTVTDIVAQSGPTRESPDGDELTPCPPGVAGEDGCPYIAQLREFAIGAIAEGSEEGRRIASHRDCPRCGRWLEFFTRQTGETDMG